MARSLPSPADRQLLDAAKSAGYSVSPFQLERWRTLGLVPRNVRRGLGRGRGTISVVPDDALFRLIAVAKTARQGRALVPDPVFARVVNGRPVSDTDVRSRVLKHLRRLTRQVALGDQGDTGWQTRYERARRGAGRPFDLDMLMPDAEADLLAEDDNAGWRDAAATMAHALAGDIDGISGEDLTRAMATITGKLSPDEVSQIVANVHSGEFAGEDLAASLVRTMAVTRLMDSVAITDITTLKRAIAAVCTVGALHGLLFIQGLHEVARSEGGSTALDGLLPEHLTRFPDGLAELRAHPAYRWLSGLSPRTRLFPVSVALLSMQLVGAPAILQMVEDYRDRLTAALEPTEPAKLDTLQHLKDAVASR